jgi:opacity protein-like surface antigen
MKKIVISFIVCSLLALPALSFGETGMYGRLSTGYSIMSDSDISASATDPGVTASLDGEASFDGGVLISGALGYMFDNYRIEVEIAHNKNDLDTVSAGNVIVNGAVQAGTAFSDSTVNGDISSTSFLVNGYYDFDTGSKSITPYLTAGLGMMKVDLKTSGSSEDDTVFAYQIGVGVGFPVGESVTIDCGYRYTGAADAEYSEIVNNMQGTSEASVAGHSFMIGVRIPF